ncbi:MAG TPA: prolyl oligopeptidase family serine peptidase [Thermoanaerobaculia bacterium]|nr:prolyl oligopeptidase family serine peptidase [Thermoanaerobaculia bacterium]
MKRAAFLVLLLSAPCAAQWSYPPTKTVDAADTYFGKTYKDPYRWLEDLKSKDVEAWFKAQAEMTDGVMAKIPGTEALVKEWTALDKLQPARYTAITWENGRVFYKKTLGGENVGKAYYRQGWNGTEKLLFDPAGYKAGVTTTIEAIVPSIDGRLVAMGFSAKGAEYSEIRILDVDKGTLLPESFYPSYGPIGWTMDSKYLFYDAGNTSDTKSLEIEQNRKTKLHKVGSDFAGDADFFSNKSYPELGIQPKEFPFAAVDESYPDYVFGQVSTVQNELKVFYAPSSGLTSGKLKWRALCAPSDDLVRGLAFHGEDVYAVTHAGAPRYKVVRTSVKHPDWAHANTVLPEAKDSVQAITKSKDYLFAAYSNGIVGRLVRYEFATGKASEIPLPASGTLNVTCPDFRTNRCLVALTSWTKPVTVYDLDGEKGAFTKSIFNTDVTYPGFDTLVTEEVEVPGHDGTPVPLSIIHKKGLPLDGSASCILEGYGAYGISYDPSFSVRRSIALRGVVIAYAHVRGGSEKGEAWYKAGYKATKPNTWKDFISCAEYLVKHGYTSPAHLAGTGTSAGGILISRAVTSRPDLFAAAVCNVGDANAMRMEFSPNGPVNTPEFGTVKDPAECAALYEMDGVQHVQTGTKYPAVLCVAGWNDPRVVPWEPGKFAAALQNASTSGKPVLLKVNYDNGHFTEEKVVTFRNFAAQDAFMLWQTGHGDFQPVK